MSHEHHRAAADRWNKILAPYFGPEPRRSVFQLLASAVPFFLLWYAAYRSLEVSYWLTLALSIPTAGFLMRLFMIQHDLGHGSFLKSRFAADTIGFWIGVLTLTPYRYWRKTHAYHHAHSGDLDFRAFGDIATKTVREYLALSPFLRLKYRVYRNPFVLFGFGAMFHFVVKHRFPWDIPRSWKREWGSVWKTNVAVAAVVTLLGLTIGFKAFVLVHLPILALSTGGGVWLFYVQHQFEESYWYNHEEWSYFDAALEGSTHLVLPKPLQWITANIGLHHVHHLSARIPNYRLQECLDENPELQTAVQITMWDGMKTLFLSLYDEHSRRLVSFREARRLIRERGVRPSAA